MVDAAHEIGLPACLTAVVLNRTGGVVDQEMRCDGGVLWICGFCCRLPAACLERGVAPLPLNVRVAEPACCDLPAPTCCRWTQGRLLQGGVHPPTGRCCWAATCHNEPPCCLPPPPLRWTEGRLPEGDVRTMWKSGEQPQQCAEWDAAAGDFGNGSGPAWPAGSGAKPTWTEIKVGQLLCMMSMFQ